MPIFYFEYDIIQPPLLQIDVKAIIFLAKRNFVNVI